MELFDVVAQIESNRNFRALRFEPMMLARIQNQPGPFGQVISAIRHWHQCSGTTAQVIAATSWGAVQIMGFNLWLASTPGLGVACHFADYLANETLQRQKFIAYAEGREINFALEELVDPADGLTKCQLFALRYNGPGDVDDYAGRLQQAAKSAA